MHKLSSVETNGKKHASSIIQYILYGLSHTWWWWVFYFILFLIRGQNKLQHSIICRWHVADQLGRESSQSPAASLAHVIWRTRKNYWFIFHILEKMDKDPTLTCIISLFRSFPHFSFSQIMILGLINDEFIFVFILSQPYATHKHPKKNLSIFPCYIVIVTSWFL